ncbi:MAG: glycogen/starch synthase, partial [Chloroflexota bacterium]|nr:glycogen/starch synthase [Chloroflexota bacterium]
MHIAMVASECEPFAKTGGLADVVDALSRALGRLGHEVDVYLPRYRGVAVPARSETVTLRVPTGDGSRTTVDLLSVPADGYRLRLVDHPPSFDRPDFYTAHGRDYPDNGARFALLGRAALEAMRFE